MAPIIEPFTTRSIEESQSDIFETVDHVLSSSDPTQVGAPPIRHKIRREKRKKKRLYLGDIYHPRFEYDSIT